MKSASKAEWVINNTTLDILNNDPQRLIECTEPGDRVIFKLSGVQKFNRTLVVSHELELISGSSEKAKDEVEYKNSLSFTCPDSGPFLIVNATNITANGFVIENCKKSSGNSIIVIKKRSSAVFENIEISDNNNRAIYIESQSFGALKNSRFNNDGRSRLKGGVVYVASNVSLTISNSSFFGNEAYAGGVLLAYASNVVAIAGSSFSENNASYGGAIYLSFNNVLTVHNSTMSQNKANYNGGAIYFRYNNSIEIENSTISQNNAECGGAIFLANDNTLDVHTSTMSQNNAWYSGGAIYIYDDNSMEIKNSTISQNKAKYNGGAIRLYKNNTLDVHTSTMSRNNASRNGGAVNLNAQSVATINDSTLINNSADSGGALILSTSSSVTIFNTAMKNNSALRDGGALNLNEQSVATITESVFLNNTADSGGALMLSKSCTMTMFNSVLKDNNAKRNGGALNLESQSSAIINESTLTYNSADLGGALILQESSLVTIFKSVLENNTASRNGGALNLNSQSCATINESTFSYNSADLGGALILQKSSTVTIFISVLKNNSASRNGGALNLNAQSVATVIESILSNNQALQNGGALNLESQSKAIVNESSLSNNVAKIDGGAVFARLNNNCTFSNSELSNNTAKHNGGAMYLCSTNLVILSNLTFGGNTAQNGSSLILKLNTTVRATISKFLNNEASGHATIYASNDCNISMRIVTFTHNRAAYGGCLYSNHSTLRVLDSVFIENESDKHGGCFYLESSNASFKNTQISQNNALEDGGAIHATMVTVLHVENSFMHMNQANNGGAIRLMLASRFFCYNCTIKNNSAVSGGGCYIEGNAEQHLLAQMTSSNVEANTASDYGGGMVIKVLGTRNVNCFIASVRCGRVLLINTSFIDNFAFTFGTTLVVTKRSGVLVSCDKMEAHGTRDFMDKEVMEKRMQDYTLETLGSQTICASWQSNHALASAHSNMIGTFGHKFDISIDSTHEQQLRGDVDSGFVISNLLSGQEICNITFTTLDAFGNGLAPIFHDKDAISLHYNSAFRFPANLSFKSGRSIFNGRVGLVLPGTYEIQFNPRNDDDALEATTLTLVTRNCTINEEPNLDGAICKDCGNASYNFDLSREGKCALCPREANCTKSFIFPIDGYWHKSPCHDKLKKCIVEKACYYMSRTQELTNFTHNSTNCSFSETALDEYEDVQCSEGHKGRLCGSCKTSYGLSSNLECLKCKSVRLSVLRLLLVILCLFVTTNIAIKGTLPIASRRLIRQDAMPPMREDINTNLLEEGTNAQARQMSPEESRAPPSTTNDEEPISPNVSSQLAHGITIAHSNLVEAWKILLNFLQITSTAATMDVKWTSKVLEFFEMLNILSAATLNAISRPIDCLVGSFSIGARAIGRFLFGLLVPTMVIAILSVYWGYRSLMKCRAERWYFWKRLLLTTITVTYITYFDITQVTIRAFNCVRVYDNIDPFVSPFTRYWTGDTSIECFTSTHVVLIAISIVFLIVVSIGFPIACSIALLRSKNEVNVSNSRAHEVLGLLCGPFKERFVYWECITMIKKAMLSIIIVFSYSLGNQAQGLLISVVLVFFLTLHSTCYPFKEDFNMLNYYEIGSLMTSCITYTLVEFFNIDTLSETDRSLVFVALVVVNGSYVIFMALNIARNLILYAKASLKLHHTIGIHDEISWFKTIKIYISSWWFGRLSPIQN